MESGVQFPMDRIYAGAEFANSIDNGSSEQPLGILPHQIRGSLSQFSQMTLVGHSSNSCTGCCSTVKSDSSIWLYLLIQVFDGVL